uniref:SRP54-type proteins GTP-binding domain-containing protein n=1 Tax=Amorphochlora amoebiformis TaxID=1561963 RepID=A0A7S0CUD9_9EUKA|mmetsp:Transcript_13973/g.22121  ORF Transcript_13973/g.22121 Transcript_13973/m.22121 type:complete len:367 (+) Transcript_13973:89-1189(+)
MRALPLPLRTLVLALLISIPLFYFTLSTPQSLRNSLRIRTTTPSCLTLPRGMVRNRVERKTKSHAEAGVVDALKKSLSKSRNALQQQFNLLMTGEVDDDTIDELEEQLLMADVGISTTTVLLDPLRDAVARGETNAEILRDLLRSNMRDILEEVHEPLQAKDTKMWVVLVVGVNGAGKTTTIAKMANRFKKDGRKVMLAAADTFRAAAVDQLGVWADRIGVEMTKPRDDKCKPSTVVFDALEAARDGGYDTVLVDTAGRLQNKEGLMDELNKIYRAVKKTVPDGPHETLLVIDGTVGQNSVIQAKEFNQVAPLTGVVVTKLDGSSKGGAIFSIAQDLKLPVRLIGVGEKMEDLRDFDPESFVEALA